jgi:polysaccharide biosynthesis transport protein
MSVNQPYRMAEVGGVGGALLRRWWIVLGLAIVCGGIAFALTARQPKQYQATAELVFRPSQLELSLFNGTVNGGTGDATRDSATDVLLASTSEVADRAAASLGGGLTGGAVRSHVTVASAGQSNVVNITATDSQPARAAELANAWARAFVSYRTATERTEIDQATHQLRAQLAGMTRAERNSFTGETLGQRLQDLGLLRTVNSGGAQIIQTASAPSSPSGPKTTRNTLLAAAVGLLLGVAVAILVDRRILLRAAVAVPEELGPRRRSAA